MRGNIWRILESKKVKTGNCFWVFELSFYTLTQFPYIIMQLLIDALYCYVLFWWLLKGFQFGPYVCMCCSWGFPRRAGGNTEDMWVKLPHMGLMDRYCWTANYYGIYWKTVRRVTKNWTRENMKRVGFWWSRPFSRPADAHVSLNNIFAPRVSGRKLCSR